VGGVDEYGDLSRWRIVVDTELDQGGGFPPEAVASAPVGEFGELVGDLAQGLVDDGARVSVEPSSQSPPRFVEGGLEDQILVGGAPCFGF